MPDLPAAAPVPAQEPEAPAAPATPTAPDYAQQFGRELTEDETGLLDAFTSPTVTPEGTGSAPAPAPPAAGDGALPETVQEPLSDAPVPEGTAAPGQAEPGPTATAQPAASAPSPAPAGTIDFLGEQITNEQAQYLLTVGQWFAGLSDDERTLIDTTLRTGQPPAPAASGAVPQPQAPGAAAPTPQPQPQPAPAPEFPTLTDEQLGALDPDTAAIVRAQQAQMAYLHDQFTTQLAPVTQTVAQLQAEQQARQQAEWVAVADQATDAFVAAHQLPTEQRLAITNAAAPYLPVFLQQTNGDFRAACDKALTTAYFADERFRAQALASEAQRQSDVRLAETLETRQKAAKSGALAGSAASVPRDQPAPKTREERFSAMTSEIASALNNGQGN